MVEHKDVSRRIEAIDVLRGFAALMVTWWHVFNHDVRYFHSDLLQGIASATAIRGSLGVNIFFAISGFVIPISAVGGGKSILYFRALAKRMTRLYPPFLISLVLAVILLISASLIPGFAGMPPTIPLKTVFLNAIYLAPFFGLPWINPVFWTLLVEVQYYLIIYLVLKNIERIPPVRLVWATCAVALIPLTLQSFSLILDFVDCFAVGFLAFLVLDERIKRHVGLIAAIVPLVVVAVDKNPLAAILVAVTAAFCTRRGTAPRLLVGLGTISYSLYLTHYFVGTKILRLLLRFVPHNDIGTALAYLLAMSACVVAAILFYVVAEKPAIAWANRISARPRPADHKHLS